MLGHEIMYFIINSCDNNLDGCWFVRSGGLLGVDRLSLVADLSNEAQHVVSGVGGGLNTSIRQSNHKLALYITLKD